MRRNGSLWWLVVMFPVALFLGSCGGSDDDGNNGGGGTQPSTGPTAPEPFEFDSGLVENEDTPAEVQGAAAMATGMMQAGNAYLGLASGEGTPSGEDCYEWTVTEEGVTVRVGACETTSGYTWSVSYAEGGAELCTVMRGTSSTEGLSGSWTYFNCPGDPDAKVMECVWTSDGAGHFRSEMFMWDAALGPVPLEDDDEDYYFLYDENADGSGYSEYKEGGVLQWTMDWKLEDGTLQATFCIYIDGQLDECVDINEGYDPGGEPGDSPPPPGGFDLDDDLLDAENLPDEVAGLVALIESMLEAGTAWFDEIEGEGTYLGDGCWEWLTTEGDQTVRVVACVDTDQSVAWSVFIGPDPEDLCLLLEGWESGDGTEGNWMLYACPQGDGEPVLTTSWETDGEGYLHAQIDIWTGEGRLARLEDDPAVRFIYEEHADGTGWAECYEEGVIVWSLSWQLDGETLTGEWCTYTGGVLDECIDLEDIGGGGGGEPDPPVLGVPFEFRPELLDPDTTPDPRVKDDLEALESIQLGALDWLEPPSFEPTYEDDCWVWEIYDPWSEDLLSIYRICEDLENDEACWEYWQDLDFDGELDLVVEGCAGLESLGGWLNYHFAGGAEMAWWIDDDPVAGTKHLTFGTGVSEASYDELPDGSGYCDYETGFGGWYCTWDEGFQGEYCFQATPGGEYDCDEF